MNCTESQTLILEELFGELDPKRRREFQDHLESCPACALELAQHQSTLELCLALPLHPAPDKAREAIMHAAREAVAPRKLEIPAEHSSWFVWPTWRVLAPTAGLAAILLAAIITPFVVHKRDLSAKIKRQNPKLMLADASSSAPREAAVSAASAKTNTVEEAEPLSVAEAPAAETDGESSFMALAEVPPSLLPDQEVQFKDTLFSQPQPVPLYESSGRGKFIAASREAKPQRTIPLRRTKQPGRSATDSEASIKSATWTRRDVSSGERRVPAELITEAGLLAQAEHMAEAGLLTQAAGAYTFFLINFSGSSRAPEVWQETIHCLFKAGKYKAARHNDEYLRQRLPALNRQVPPFDELLRMFQNK